VKYVLCIVLGSLITISINYFNHHSQQKGLLDPKTAHEEINKLVIDKSCPVECGRLGELEKHEQRYFENKEFIPKAILAYLAAVGFKVASKDKEEINKILKDPKSYKTSKKTLIQSNNGHEVATFSKKDLVADKYVIKESGSRLFIHPTNSEFIKITNSSKFIKKYINILRINGSYNGFLNLASDTGPKRRPKMVYMELDFEQRSRGNIVGEYKVEIQNYKSKSGTGVNKIILINQKTGMVSIKISPGTFFIFPSLEMFKKGVLEGWYFKNKRVQGSISLIKSEK